MKLYYWNFIALGLILLSWLMIRLGYLLLPKTWEAAIWHLGFLVYLLAFAGLGWSALRSVWGAFQGTLPWGRVLVLVGITALQGLGTLFFFIIVLAEGFNTKE
jgi:hypothetical protein